MDMRAVEGNDAVEKIIAKQVLIHLLGLWTQQNRATGTGTRISYEHMLIERPEYVYSLLEQNNSELDPIRSARYNDRRTECMIHMSVQDSCNLLMPCQHVETSSHIDQARTWARDPSLQSFF